MGNYNKKKIPSISELRYICQKEKLKKNTGLTLLNRKISIYATWLLLHLGLTANHVSLTSIFLGIAASAVMTFESAWMTILSTFMLYLSFLMDQVDGEVARFYNQSSLQGVYLDELRHLIIYAFPVFALSFVVYKDIDNSVVFVLGFCLAFALIMDRVKLTLQYVIFLKRVVYKTFFPAERFINSINIENTKAHHTINKQPAKQPLHNILLKSINKFFYKFYALISDQVNILIILVLFALLDLTFEPINLFNVEVYYRTLFFFFFCFCGVYIVPRNILGYFKNNTIEKDCTIIYNDLKKMFEI